MELFACSGLVWALMLPTPLKPEMPGVTAHASLTILPASPWNLSEHKFLYNPVPLPPGITRGNSFVTASRTTAGTSTYTSDLKLTFTASSPVSSISINFILHASVDSYRSNGYGQATAKYTDNQNHTSQTATMEITGVDDNFQNTGINLVFNLGSPQTTFVLDNDTRLKFMTLYAKAKIN